MRNLLILKEYVMINVKQILRYRIEIFVKLAGYPIKYFMIYFFWISFLDAKRPAGINREYIISYYLVVLFITQMYPYIRKSRQIKNEIFSGDIVTYRQRNIPYIVVHIGEYIATVTIYLAIVSPICVILFLSFTKYIPSIYCIFSFILTFFIGSLIKFLIVYALGIIAFLTTENRGIIIFFFQIEILLSGALLPISMFPTLFQKIISYLPFPYFIYYPVDSLLHAIPVSELIEIIGIQLTWLIILLTVIKYIWWKGEKTASMNAI